ncbi:MAG: helix-turn-helix domain-containing protein [Patescibacteria group bacterium]|nr:helix-turn-helix domain-containing protein [Patescibacteria group bacterium]
MLSFLHRLFAWRIHRRRRLSVREQRFIVDRFRDGVGVPKIAQETGHHHSTIYRFLKREGLR